MGEKKLTKLYDDKVFQDISTFLNEAKMYSDKTAESYEIGIRQFFKIMRNKEIEFLSEDDLIFKRNDILKYRHILSEMKKDNDPTELKYKPSTINQKLAGIKSLYENLKSNDYDINPAIFKIKKLPEQINPYGKLSHTEADRMAHTVFKTENTKAYAKHCLILFATRTSFRLDALLSMKWSDIESIDGVRYEVELIDKGKKKRRTSFSKVMYDKLIKLKEENKKYKWDKDSDIIFQISKDSINDMMERLRKELNISKKDNIVFHSFRGIAMDKVFEEDGIEAAIEYSGHSSYDTMVKHYIQRRKNYANSPGIRMDEELDLSFLDQLTLENFKEFIVNGDYKIQAEIKKYFESLHK